jgi:hypothetical protein
MQQPRLVELRRLQTRLSRIDSRQWRRQRAGVEVVEVVEVAEVEEVTQDKPDYIQYSILYMKINVLRLNSTQVMYVNRFSIIAPTTATTYTIAGGSLD